MEREQHQPGAPTSEFHGPSSPEKMLVEPGNREELQAPHPPGSLGELEGLSKPSSTIQEGEDKPSTHLEENLKPDTKERTSDGGIQPESLDCIIRRGRCQNHNIEARKIVTKSKKWGKVKTGYG